MSNQSEFPVSIRYRPCAWEASIGDTLPCPPAGTAIDTFFIALRLLLLAPIHPSELQDLIHSPALPVRSFILAKASILVCMAVCYP